MSGISHRFGAARAAVAAALAMFVFPPAHAAVECIGKPGPVLLYKDGLVAALITWNTGGSGFYQICNTNGEFGGISSEVCLAWYATLMRAKGQVDPVEEKLLPLNVALYFEANVSCAQLPGNSDTPLVHYLGLY